MGLEIVNNKYEFYCIVLHLKKERNEKGVICDEFQVLGKVLWKALEINWCSPFSLFHSYVINFNIAFGNNNLELLYCIHSYFSGKTVCLSPNGKILLSSTNTIMNNKGLRKVCFFQKSIEA